MPRPRADASFAASKARSPGDQRTAGAAQRVTLREYFGSVFEEVRRQEPMRLSAEPHTFARLVREARGA
jgi:hypothetical protein